MARAITKTTPRRDSATSMAVLRAISHRSLGPRRGARGQPADRQEGEADADGGDSDKPGNAPELTLERSPFAVLTLSVSAAIRPGSVCVPVVCARLLRPSAQVSARPWLVVGSRARARDAVDLYLAPRRRRAGPRRRGGRRAGVARLGRRFSSRTRRRGRPGSPTLQRQPPPRSP